MNEKEEKELEKAIKPIKIKKPDKYEQFEHDLELAVQRSTEAGIAEREACEGRDYTFDCNFYGCLIRLPRWRGERIISICKKLGVFIQKWPVSGWWNIAPSSKCGRGSGRMVGAYVLAEEMYSKGYEVQVYEKMD